MVAELAVTLALDGAVEDQAGAWGPFGKEHDVVRSILLMHAGGPEARAALEFALAAAVPVGRDAPCRGEGRVER